MINSNPTDEQNPNIVQYPPEASQGSRNYIAKSDPIYTLCVLYSRIIVDGLTVYVGNSDLIHLERPKCEQSKHDNSA